MPTRYGYGTDTVRIRYGYKTDRQSIGSQGPKSTVRSAVDFGSQYNKSPALNDLRFRTNRYISFDCHLISHMSFNVLVLDFIMVSLAFWSRSRRTRSPPGKVGKIFVYG